MSVVIKGFDKPKSCLSCRFNRDDCWCSITHGGIDRDFYSCDLPCPIKSLDDVLDEIIAKIEQERVGYPPSADYYKSIMKCLQIIDKYKE